MDILRRLLARTTSSILGKNPVAAPGTPATKTPSGATAIHYRAFSLLRSRLNGMGHRIVMERFRNTARRIRLVDDAEVRAEALLLLDRFAAMVDQYVPQWKKAIPRNKQEAKILEIELGLRMVVLERELGWIIDRGQSGADDRKGIDGMGRSIDERDAECEEYGLTTD